MVPRRTVNRALLCSVVLSGLGAAAHAKADEPAALSGDDALAGLQLRGQSLFRWFGLEVYRATLYTGADFAAERFETQRLALELAYRRAFEGSDIAQRSIEEMQGIEPLTPSQARDWRERMARLFPDVQPGDRLLGLHEPGRGARFYANGRRLGAVDDALFSARFFGIWLSPRTSQPRLREALVAGGGR